MRIDRNLKIVVFTSLFLLTLACYLPIKPMDTGRNSFDQEAIIKNIFTFLSEINSSSVTQTPVGPTIMVHAAAPTPTNTPSPPQIPPTQIEKPTNQPSAGEPTGRIIYTCQVDKNPSHDQICMINPDGSGFTQLTNDLTKQHFYPSWALDGEGFLFSGVQDYEFKIFQSDLYDQPELIGSIPGSLYAPMSSLDGTRIVFTRHVNETSQFITVYDREAETYQDLTNYYDAKDPVWSPDGSKILFTSLEDDTPQLYFMNADGSFIQKISALAGLRGRADWSVDLAIVTYAGEFKEHNREIILLTLGGTPQILTEGGDNLAPSFSPDGQWIVFMSYRDNFWHADGCELYIMRRDGADIRRLTDNDYCDYQPRWGP